LSRVVCTLEAAVQPVDEVDRLIEDLIVTGFDIEPC
jgi:hypothetical protein